MYGLPLMSWGGSEKNRWFQLDASISMLWMSSGESWTLSTCSIFCCFYCYFHLPSILATSSCRSKISLCCCRRRPQCPVSSCWRSVIAFRFSFLNDSKASCIWRWVVLRRWRLALRSLRSSYKSKARISLLKALDTIGNYSK